MTPANCKGAAKSPTKSPAKSPGGISTPGSSGKQARSSTYKRLGEAVIQGLYNSFKQNQYPDRSAKENLAKELGITLLQVLAYSTCSPLNAMSLDSLRLPHA
ncbi:hypothetical protein V6N12_036395 [Hibiscus sabdariffa]|uniref:Homeobox domain-containing protein n=1 Tax=Hibiscus sabdariffa TaxID=183260 RepID=A0ABR2EQH3_9ROSI